MTEQDYIHLKQQQKKRSNKLKERNTMEITSLYQAKETLKTISENIETMRRYL